eukprot:jgi/Ulvmu1/6592/UM003_0229.1
MALTGCTAEERPSREPPSVVLSVTGDRSSAVESLTYRRPLSPHARQTRRQCASVQWPSSTVVAAVFCLLCLVVAANTWGHTYVIMWMKWLQQHETQGRVLFVLSYTSCLLLLLPASLLAILAGVCFGLYWGIILVYTANLLGQTIAFLLAKTLLHKPLRGLITARWPQFPSVDAAIRREGWRLVFVLRLSPCIPFAVLNYALGLTGISLLEYSAASAVAIIPFAVISVYLGLASGSALQMLQAHAWTPAASHINTPVQVGGKLAAGAVALGNATAAAGGGSVSPGHSTAVTAAACVLAVATGAYSVWFVRRVTSEALADVLEDGLEGARAGALAGAGAGGAGGGDGVLDDAAEVATPPADVASHSIKRGMRLGDTGAAGGWLPR